MNVASMNIHACVPPYSYVEFLTSNGMILRGGDFGRWLGSEDAFLMNEIGVLIKKKKKTPGCSVTAPLGHSGDIVRKGSSMNQEMGLHQDTESANTTILNFSAFWTMRNFCCLYCYTVCGTLQQQPKQTKTTSFHFSGTNAQDYNCWIEWYCMLS